MKYIPLGLMAVWISCTALPTAVSAQTNPALDLRSEDRDQVFVNTLQGFLSDARIQPNQVVVIQRVMDLASAQDTKEPFLNSAAEVCLGLAAPDYPEQNLVNALAFKFQNEQLMPVNDAYLAAMAMANAGREAYCPQEG